LSALAKLLRIIASTVRALQILLAELCNERVSEFSRRMRNLFLSASAAHYADHIIEWAS
jgi:hypothetical protein